MSELNRPQFVVFDLGNVLMRWNPYDALAPTLGQQAADDFLTNPEANFFAHNLSADGGRPWADIATDLDAVNPAWGHAARVYAREFPSAIAHPILGSVEILQELDAAGVPLFALTNFSAELFGHAEAQHEFLRIFRGIVVSGRVGLVKPQPEIFHRLDAEFTHSVGPLSAGLFIDDSDVNVAGARAVGLDAVPFTSPDQLRLEVQRRGLLG